MTDLDPNTEVYHPSTRFTKGSERIRLHTNPECRYLSFAKTVYGPKLVNDCDPGLKICKECAGEVDRSDGGDHTLNKKLEACNPEEIGLSPLGERYE